MSVSRASPRARTRPARARPHERESGGAPDRDTAASRWVARGDRALAAHWQVGFRQIRGSEQTPLSWMHTPKSRPFGSG